MLVFGKGFLQSGPTVLGILVLGSLFTALSGSAGLLLTMSNHQYTELSCLGGYALLNISLNLLWIPQYGIVGAAFATTLSNIATVSIRILMTYLHLKMHPFSKNFVIPVVTTSILCLAGLLAQSIFQMGALMQMALSLCTAFLVLLSIIVGGLDTSDNELFSMLREKLTKDRVYYPSSNLR